MIAALIDNGSLEPAAHRNLRGLAATLSARTGIEVHAVSWKHSNRIPADKLGGQPAWTLVSWLSAQITRGEREIVFIPFFVSAQGAIGSWLRRDLEQLQQEIGPFRFVFTAGLATQGNLAAIAVARIRQIIMARQLNRPPVVVVDHGGPSAASSALRDQTAAEITRLLGPEIRAARPASLEGGEYVHNLPLFADALGSPGFDQGDVVVAPLFLAPGRHAGPHGDLVQIAASAEDRMTATPLRCHFTESIGTHPRIAEVLAEALTTAVSTVHIAA